ncbi:MAG: nicotinamide mononucleotide transporter [Clostridia bacterium]|nr:nicotinamide mononucleotide transporter [Clostridia bacterium]
MQFIKSKLNYFTPAEWLLWGGSASAIVVSFLLFDRESGLTLCASLLGVTSLILCAKGNPLGQLLMVIFSLLYGWISFTFAYYGEMITYVGMSGPMALAALIAWVRHPYKGNKSEVEVNHVHRQEYLFMALLTAAVTVLFYFILDAFGTANLLPSTISVTTSFAAVYLTYRRSPFYALAYAANDVILIVLWLLAALEDSSYISVIVCFATFLFNDIYGFISWRRMEQRQTA